MTALGNLLDGRAFAEETHRGTAARVAKLATQGVRPGLAFVRVGEDPASQVYVGMKEKMSQRLGIHSTTHVLPADATQDHLLGLIRELNGAAEFDGILVQAPLPRQIDPNLVYSSVDPRKDVDGFHPVNVGKLLLGDPDCFWPCTPAGVMEILRLSGARVEGAEVVVLGRGNIVGKPMAAMLLQKAPNANATVTLCHSQTRDIAAHCRRADILVAAMGSPLFVKAGWVKPGAVVIDVGVNRVPDPQAKGGSRLVGDVDFDNVRKVAGHITPNPGGVGPMTIAMLMRNTVVAAERRPARTLST